VSVANSPAHAETAADRAESVQAARTHLVETVDRVRDRAERAGVDLEHIVIEGDRPAEDLLAYAHEHAFDLIIAGHPERAERDDCCNVTCPSGWSPTPTSRS
jgi:nucleotide-binding universal stress UspA family protein